jgi:hypothetical protein
MVVEAQLGCLEVVVVVVVMVVVVTLSQPLPHLLLGSHLHPALHLAVSCLQQACHLPKEEHLQLGPQEQRQHRLQPVGEVVLKQVLGMAA